MKSDSEDSSTDSKGPWDPERAKRKHKETKRLLKAFQKDLALKLQQAASGTKRARQTMETTPKLKDTEPQRNRSRSRSPPRGATHRRTRSRSPEQSSRPLHRHRSHSRSPPRRSPPKSSHERRSPARDTKTRRSPPRSSRLNRSPPKTTPFTVSSQQNQYAKSYTTTAQDRSHNR